MASNRRSTRVRAMVIALTSVLLVALTVQASVATAEDLIMEISVTDTTLDEPEDGCEEEPPTMSPYWRDLGPGNLEVDYDLFIGGNIVAPIALSWTAGTSGDCTGIDQTGEITTTLSVSKVPDGDPGTWTMSNGCVDEVCLAASTLEVVATITPPPDLTESEQYLATVTVIWTP